MENFALIALAESLRPVAEGFVVRRVVQHHGRGFLLQSRSSRIPALKLYLDPRSPVLYVSATRPPVDPVSTEFLMILRKHLVGARLVEFRKPLSERVLELSFKTALPARELSSVHLVLELFPNAPNVILLDEGRRILAAAKPAKELRAAAEGELYRYPETGRIDLAAALESDDWFDETAYLRSSEYLIHTVAGVGPLLAREVAHRAASTARSPLEALSDIVSRCREPGSTAWVYSSRPLSLILAENDVSSLQQAVISPVEMGSLRRSHSAQTYPGMLEATRAVFEELESRTLLSRAKAPVLGRLHGQRRRLDTRRKRLRERQQRFSAASELRISGQLLTSSGADLDRCYENLEVTDYFANPPRPRRIALDGSRTLRNNLSRMFKEYRKSERGLDQVERQLSDLEVEERRLTEQERRIAAIGDWETWLSSSSQESGGQGRREPASRQAARRRPSNWISGHEVLVGRNGRDNDNLTFRVAAQDDFWFHVADYSGAHVVVRNPERTDRLDETLLLRAAQLAAYHSQARNSSKVDVHYTQRRFVSKPRKAPPGQVRLREFRTVTVEPRAWTERASGAEETLDQPQPKT